MPDARRPSGERLDLPVNSSRLRGRWALFLFRGTVRVFVSALVVAVFGGLVTTSAPVAQGVPKPKPATILTAAEQSVIGTIDRFEETARRLVLATKEGPVAFVLATDVVVRLGSRVLPPGALATHHGRRAKVRFTQANGRRTAHWVVISSEPPRIAN